MLYCLLFFSGIQPKSWILDNYQIGTFTKSDIFFAISVIIFLQNFKYGQGGCFSKAPETFRARKAIAKSRTL